MTRLAALKPHPLITATLHYRNGLSSTMKSHSLPALCDMIIKLDQSDIERMELLYTEQADQSAVS